MTDPEKPRIQNSERGGFPPIEWQHKNSDTSVQEEPRCGHRDVESDHERLEDSS